MDYKTLCNNSKCTKRMKCSKYINWLHNVVKLDMTKFISRTEKECKNYELFNRDINR